jgi:hypothetical protein
MTAQTSIVPTQKKEKRLFVAFIERPLVLSAIVAALGSLALPPSLRSVMILSLILCGAVFLIEVCRSKLVVDPIFRFAACVSLVAGMVIGFSFLDNTVLDPPPRLSVVPRRVLSHPDSLRGIPWKVFWGAVKLDIENDGALLEKLDMTFQTIQAPLFAVEETGDSGIGCELRPEDSALDDQGMRVSQGGDGKVTVTFFNPKKDRKPVSKNDDSYTLTARDLNSLGGPHPFLGTNWKMFCPQLPAGRTLRLLLATPIVNGRLMATRVRVLGHKIDRTVEIE